jgi:hypothetical protein
MSNNRMNEERNRWINKQSRGHKVEKYFRIQDLGGEGHGTPGGWSAENGKVPVVEEVKLLGHWVIKRNSHSPSMMARRLQREKLPVRPRVTE